MSIIVPCYNAGKWLEESLSSAFAQTWSNTEVILVNDGSSDDSMVIAARFIPRGLKTVLQDHSTASRARNTGFQACTGDYIQYLDADDILSPDKIEAQMHVLSGAGPGAIASSRWGRFFKSPAEATPATHDVFRDFVPGWRFLAHVAATGEMMQPAAWLTPRPLIERAGGWNESLTRNDDGEFFARLFARGAEIRFSAKGFVYYRFHGGNTSLSRRKSPDALRSLYASAVLFEQHLVSVDDSAQTRMALSNFWSRMQVLLYPLDRHLSGLAAERHRALGGGQDPASFGPRTRLLAGLVGWRLARTLQAMIRVRS